jgi:hypothetical protein
MLSKLAARVDLLEGLDPLLFSGPPLAPARPRASSSSPNSSFYSAEQFIPALHQHIPRLNLEHAPSASLSSSAFSAMRGVRSLFPIPEKTRATIPSPSPLPSAAPEPVLKRRRKERMQRKKDPMSAMEWLNVSPRARLLQAVRADLPTLFDCVRVSSAMHATTASSSVVLVSPRNVSGRQCAWSGRWSLIWG